MRGIILSGSGIGALVAMALARRHFEANLLVAPQVPPPPFDPNDPWSRAEREEVKRGEERGRLAQERRERRSAKRAANLAKTKAGIEAAKARLQRKEVFKPLK